ncbi:MAG: hypothetical protein K6G25_07880 [Bacteroidales bacterium]|nr:hypothetical protein [Bacteroidales bacterium]
MRQKYKKINLTLTQQDERVDYFFTQYKTARNALTVQNSTTGKVIDCMVYQLYGLTKDEIMVVKRK